MRELKLRLKIYQIPLSMLLSISLILSSSFAGGYKSKIPPQALSAPSAFDGDLSQKVSAKASLLKHLVKVTDRLPSAETSQGLLVVATIILAVFDNPIFEMHKLYFLVPLAVFEAILLFIYVFDKKFRDEKSLFKSRLAFFLFAFFLIVSSASLTPIVMDYISIQLFASYSLIAVSFFITMLLIRRLFLLNSTILLSIHNFFRKKTKQSHPIKLKRERATFHAASILVHLLAVFFLFGFTFANHPIFSSLKPLSQMQENWRDYLGVKVSPTGEVTFFENRSKSRNLEGDLEGTISDKLKIIKLRTQLEDYIKNKKPNEIDGELGVAIRLSFYKILWVQNIVVDMLYSDNYYYHECALMYLRNTYTPESIPRFIELVKEETQPPLSRSIYFGVLFSHFNKVDKKTQIEIFNLFLESLLEKNEKIDTRDWLSIVSRLNGRADVFYDSFMSKKSFLTMLERITPLLEKEYNRRLNRKKEKVEEYKSEIERLKLKHNETSREVQIVKMNLNILLIKIQYIEKEKAESFKRLESTITRLRDLIAKLQDSSLYPALEKLLEKIKYEKYSSHWSNWLDEIFAFFQFLVGLIFLKELKKVFFKRWNAFLARRKKSAEASKDSVQEDEVGRLTLKLDLGSLTSGISI